MFATVSAGVLAFSASTANFRSTTVLAITGLDCSMHFSKVVMHEAILCGLK